MLVWPAGCLFHPSCAAKTLTLDIICKVFNLFLAYLQMVVGTIDFYHFIPLSLILTLAGDQKVSAKQDILASFSDTLQLVKVNFEAVLK